MLKRREFLCSAGAGALLPGAAPARPNIVFILMDDLGWPSLGCYGSRLVPTPHLDGLAAEGMRFTQAYVTPQCTPTRATLLTGQYTARNRMWHVIPWYGQPWAYMSEPPYAENLPREAFILPKGLKAAGYATACIGKWHLTVNQDGNYNSLRQEAAAYYGFDVSARPSPRPDELTTGDRAVNRLTDEAIAFIEQNRRRPFFCYLPHHTIHGRVCAPEDLVRKWRAKGYREEGLNNATYLAALEHFDAAIGRLLARLDDLKLRQNPAVVFLSDNGGVHWNYRPNPPAGGGPPIRLASDRFEFSNAPLRAMKGTAYEGGIRVPMIVRWPGVARPGAVCETPVHAVDILPTFFEIAGARAPKGRTLDGISLAPLLRREGSFPSRPLFWYMPFYDLRWGATPCAVIREGDFKLIESFGDHVDLDAAEYRLGHRLEVFNLREDLGERNNLAGKLPQRTAELQKKLHAWILSTGAEIPRPNPRYDPQRALQETRDKPAGTARVFPAQRSTRPVRLSIAPRPFS